MLVPLFIFPVMYRIVLIFCPLFIQIVNIFIIRIQVIVSLA